MEIGGAYAVERRGLSLPPTDSGARAVAQRRFVRRAP